MGRRTAGQREQSTSRSVSFSEAHKPLRSQEKLVSLNAEHSPSLPETSLTPSSPTTVLATLYRNPLPVGLPHFCPLQIYHGRIHSAFPPRSPIHWLQPFRKANPQSSPCLQLAPLGSHWTEENLRITGCLCNWLLPPSLHQIPGTQEH